ncbi:MAG: S16 family serine protease [Candidatus Xenobiia bacterium LiM19]
MIVIKDGDYLFNRIDASSALPALVSAKLKRLFVNDSGEYAVTFMKLCADAVREKRSDIILQCLSCIDYLRGKADFVLDAKSLRTYILPSSMIEATLWAALAAIDITDMNSFRLKSFMNKTSKAIASLHGKEISFRNLSAEDPLPLNGDIRQTLNALFYKIVCSMDAISPAHILWPGWVFRLIEHFIGNNRACDIRRTIAVPIYFPGNSGEICTLVVDRISLGTGAIYPHPVYANPFLLWEDAGAVIDRVANFIRQLMRRKVYDYGQCDIVWHLKRETCGKMVRALRGTSCGAGFAMSISSLFDNEEVGNCLCVTGSVSPEGRILPVRALQAKLEAVVRWARKNSKRYHFIVPRENFGELHGLLEPESPVIIDAVSSVDEILALRRCG